MPTLPLQFSPCSPVLWGGHYERIPGETSTYHIRHDDQLDVVWLDPRDPEITVRSPIEMTPHAVRLAQAINGVKQAHAGRRGGSFLINEFGQVLVPAAGTYDRYLVGEISGDLAFEFPAGTGTLAGACPPVPIACGDPWDLPYVGTVYHLSGLGRVYGLANSNGFQQVLHPPRQDPALVGALRSIRGPQGCRFLVNHHGIAITKRPRGGDWRPVYVTRINYERWFLKEAK